MTARSHKKRLFDQIARLRRVERMLPENRDVAAVRRELEHELGETLSRRLAGELLGVSHTTMRRWIGRGALPVVYDRDGRSRIPVAAVLDLYEPVTAQRAAGRRHVIEPTMRRAQDRARGIAPAQARAGDRHAAAAARALAYHRALAGRLRRAMVTDALHQVWRWRAEGKIDPRYADAWEDILRRPVAEVRSRITEDSERARDLRQNSPFAGMLSEPERRALLGAASR